MSRFYTLGHSTRSFEELVELLEAYDVTLLADIRSFPRSRTNPQFDSETLDERLPEHGIAYEHLERLGGYRDDEAPDSPNEAWENDSFRRYADYALTDDFEAGLEELISLGRDHAVAYMCSEAVYWRCHRRIVSDWLVARGHEVVHVFDADRADEHSLTRFADAENGEVTYPGGEA